MDPRLHHQRQRRSAAASIARDPHQLSAGCRHVRRPHPARPRRPRRRRWRTRRRSSSTTCSSRSARSRVSSTRSISAARKRSRRRARRSSSASRWRIRRSPRSRSCERARLRTPCSPASRRIGALHLFQFNATTGAISKFRTARAAAATATGIPRCRRARQLRRARRAAPVAAADLARARIPRDRLPGRRERRRRDLGLARGRGASASNLERLGQSRLIAGRDGTALGPSGWARLSWRRFPEARGAPEQPALLEGPGGRISVGRDRDEGRREQHDLPQIDCAGLTRDGWRTGHFRGRRPGRGFRRQQALHGDHGGPLHPAIANRRRHRSPASRRPEYRR